MYLIVAIHIYRNRFKELSLFFSSRKFNIGSIIMAPLKEKDKPALVIKVDNLNKNKSFIRRSKIKVNKITNSKEFIFLTKEIIEFIKLGSQKTSYTLEEILQKITPKKTIAELNKFNFKKEDYSEIKKFAKTISKAEIKNKIIKETELLDTLKEKTEGIKIIGSLLFQSKQKNKKLHSEKHYLVNEIRNYFGETSKKGIGSFSFYLGLFKNIPEKIIYQFWAEVKQSNKSTKDQQKLFWWKAGQYIKNNK